MVAPILPLAAFKGETPGEDVEVAVHDMPAGCSVDDLRRHWHSRSRLVVPLLPSPTDIRVAVRFLMQLNRDELLSRPGVVALIANRVRTNTTYFKVLMSFLEQVNLPVLTHIRDSQNYVRAMERGLGLFDLPSNRVAQDCEQWQPLLRWLDFESAA